MRCIITICCLLCSCLTFGQNTIEWSNDYLIKISDYQSGSTQINDSLTVNSFGGGSTVEFYYQMSNYEFMFTKNFNSKVTTVFSRNSSYIIAQDSATARDLVLFEQYAFDLSELYARRFRKELYEKKKAFSSADFFRPIYDDVIARLNEERAKMFTTYEWGKGKAIIMAAHQEVKKELSLLSDFCKSCKPPKK